MQTTGIVDARNVELYRDVEPVDLPCITIDDKGDGAIEEDNFSLRRSLELMVVFDVTGDGGADVMNNANVLLLAIETIIGQNAQWNGLAEMTTLGDYAVEPTYGAAVRTMRGGLSVSIQYTQQRLDPTKP